MDINSLLQNFKNIVPQIAESYCIVNRELMKLDEVQNMGYEDFSKRAKMKMPLKLYKYFPNTTTEIINEKSENPVIDKNIENKRTINYSIQSLKNNTVFMQSPSLFDDVYDSDISLDYSIYEKVRLLEYCKRCELNVSDTMSTQELGNALLNTIIETHKTTKRFDSIFKRPPVSEIEKLSNQKFTLSFQVELDKDNNWDEAIGCVIFSDFKEYSKNLRNTFRATCFSTTPYSQLMWGGSYADCHRGFCVEYTVLPNEPEYENQFYNLFPMIYCKVRPNMTKLLAEFETKKLTVEGLWDIYFYGALRKSIDWFFQDEWRLLFPMGKNQAEKDYCVPFFPITKVFLGNRMTQAARKEIIEICHERHIPYIGVTRNPNVFEMQECGIKCEDCPNYTGIITK